jgi:hypothetical protein
MGNVKTKRHIVKVIRSVSMNIIGKVFLDRPFALTVVVVLIFLFGAVQVADAPPLEALNPDDIPCYRIADDGRIMDSDGRGWIKGDEVYSPDLELRYRFSGRRLEDAS